jgi:flavin-dependent dehydrogenase
MEQKAWDIIVIGSGPGGSIAAKVCASAGLETLFLEKKGLPRDKVCTGMVMGPWAKNLIKEHFGDIPAEVLGDPGHYTGVTLHVGAENVAEVVSPIPVAWRKNLDYWMSRNAMQAGALCVDGARATTITPHKGGYEVEITRENKQREKLSARCVIGADGALSMVRKFIRPDLRVRYRPAYRECYREDLSIAKYRFHWFFPFVSPSPRFDVSYKEGFFLIEGGNIRRIKDNIREILRGFGFPPDARPVWRDGCVVADLYDDLLKGSFLPAKENVVLVGDAAGMLLPFTQEGIGSALKSGVLAAESVIEAIRGGGTAEERYLKKVRAVITVLKRLRALHVRMGDIAKEGPGALSEAMGEYIEKTLSENFDEL